MEVLNIPSTLGLFSVLFSFVFVLYLMPDMFCVSGISIFDCPLRYSLTFIYCIKYTSPSHNSKWMALNILVNEYTTVMPLRPIYLLLISGTSCCLFNNNYLFKANSDIWLYRMLFKMLTLKKYLYIHIYPNPIVCSNIVRAICWFIQIINWKQDNKK